MRFARKTSERQAICLRFSGQDLARLPNEFLGHLNRLTALEIDCHGVKRWHAGALRVGVANIANQACSAKHNHEPMFLHRLYEYLHAGNRHGLQFGHDRGRLIAGNPARAAVRNIPGRVDRAEIRADRDIALYWIDFTCDEKPYGIVPAKTSTLGQTYTGHRWRIRDPDTNEIIKDDIFATTTDPLTVTFP